MKADLDCEGVLHVRTESPLEQYALVKWLKDATHTSLDSQFYFRSEHICIHTQPEKE